MNSPGVSYDSPRIESGAGPLLMVNLDVLFRAATGDGDHYPHASQDYDANHDPASFDVLQNAQLPECGENATDEQGKSGPISWRTS